MSEEKTEEVRPSYSPDELPEYLPVYYKRLFPYGLYYRWLNYGGGMNLMVLFLLSLLLCSSSMIRYRPNVSVAW